jgi:Carboxypeptidase regulatory-like domain
MLVNMRVAIFALTITLLSPFNSWAQINTGRIIGTVHDAGDAVIGHAEVRATNLATGAVTPAETSASGDYLINFLIPGTYSIEVEHTGFQREVENGVVVNAGAIQRIDFTLPVGQVVQTTEVTANPTGVATETSELSVTFSNKNLQELPNIDRNPIYQLNVLPGVNSGAGSGNYGANGGENGSAIGLTRPQLVSIGGVDANANGVFVEGMLNREPQNGYVGVMPTIEDVQEVQVYTGKYNAEYGFSGSAVINVVTKSGSNDFHFALFEYLRNNALDTRNYFSKGNTPFRRNQYGGAVGGPILKNKLFYFVDYQGTNFNSSSPLYATVPSDKMYQGDFSELYQPGQPPDDAGNEYGQIYDPHSRVFSPDGSVVYAKPYAGNIIPVENWDPSAAQMNAAKIWGTANLPGISKNLYTLFTNVQTVEQGDARIDYSHSEKDRFFFRYSQFFSTTNNSTGVNVFWQNGQADSRTMNRNLQFTYLDMLTPRTSNELRIGYNRTHVVTSGADLGTPWNNQFGIPNGNLTQPETVGIAQIFVSPFHNIGAPGWVGHIVTNTYAVTENFSTVKGKHTLKFGTSLNNIGEAQTDPYPSPRGQLGFDPAMTSYDGVSEPYAYPSFLLGTMVSTQRTAWVQGLPYVNFWENAWYAQDDFKVMPSLTLNLGIRYELYTIPVERKNHESNWDPNTNELIVATSSNRTAGIKGNHNDWGPRVGFAWTPDRGKTSVRAGYGISYWQAYFVGPLTTLYETYPFFSITDVLTPNNLTPTLSLSKNGLPLATVAYDPEGNPIITSSALIHGTNPDWKNQRVDQTTLNVQREIRPGITVDIGYWHVGGANNVTNWIYGGSVNANQAPPQPPGADYNLARPLHSRYPQLGDVPMGVSTASSNYNAVTASVTARATKYVSLYANYAHARSFANGNNLDASNINQYYGPTTQDIANIFNAQFVLSLPVGRGLAVGSNMSRPLDLLIGGWQYSGFLRVASGPRFDVYSSVSLLNNGQSNRPNRLCNGAISSPTPTHWYDTSCFVDDLVPQTYGNAGINPLYADGLQQLDSSFLKTFKFTERINLEFRADLFNTFNHTNFAAPDSSVGDGSVGQVFSTSVNQRRAQLGLRLSY